MNTRPLLLLLCAPAAALADVEMNFSDGSSMVVREGRVLFGDSVNSVLFEPGREGLIVLNRQQQTWMSMKPGFADEMAARTVKRLESMLPDLPPEERAMAEQQIEDMRAQKDRAPPEFKVNRTGNRDEVAGFDCHEAEIMDGEGVAKEIVCIASAEELGIEDEDFDALSAFMDQLAEIAAMAPEDDSFIDLEVLGGVPVRSENVDYGEQSQLQTISTAAVDPARLEVPEGYEEVSIESMMGR